MGINELKLLQINGIAQLQQKIVGGIRSKWYPYCRENCLQTAVSSKIQSGRGRFKHWWIELKFGLDILFILENSWFNYIGDQRKSPKNETPYVTLHIQAVKVQGSLHRWASLPELSLVTFWKKPTTSCDGWNKFLFIWLILSFTYQGRIQDFWKGGSDV